MISAFAESTIVDQASVVVIDTDIPFEKNLRRRCARWLACS